MKISSIKFTLLSFILPLSIGLVALKLNSNQLAFLTIVVLLLSPLMISGEYRKLREGYENGKRNK